MVRTVSETAFAGDASRSKMTSVWPDEDRSVVTGVVELEPVVVGHQVRKGHPVCEAAA